MGIPASLELPGFSTDETVFILQERFYEHRIMRVNYTTYDARWAQDSFNPRTSHRDVMLLAPSTAGHQYRYARIIGIFHVNAAYSGPERRGDYNSHRLEVLWVRWFDLVDNVAVDHVWNANHPRLDCVRFKPIDDGGAFGFLDPALVLRGCHLISRFSRGPLYDDGKGRSPCARDSDDWKFYLVNRFVDRDMLMRYHWGMGVGHLYSHTHNEDDVVEEGTVSLQIEGGFAQGNGSLRILRSHRQLAAIAHNSQEEEGDGEPMLSGTATQGSQVATESDGHADQVTLTHSNEGTEKLNDELSPLPTIILTSLADMGLTHNIETEVDAGGNASEWEDETDSDGEDENKDEEEVEDDEAEADAEEGMNSQDELYGEIDDVDNSSFD
ncbi:hypothetical protein DXG01_009865 [Tephrocybe rancida]|nr:hypothetical protein DXG01_009865 [Tephrocybe rancida]